MPGRNIIVVGASAGGVEVLTKLAASLPPDLPAAIFVVVHISPHANSVLPQILNRAGSLRATHPENGEVIQPGHIYVAPPDYHLLLKPGHIHVARGPKENNHRPAVDPLFRTAARAYGSYVVGVVLSGMLDDGVAGLLAIKRQGGIAIVQNPDEALHSGMPRSAIENVEVDHILPVLKIAKELKRLADKPVQEEPEAPVSSKMGIESDMAELEQAAVHSNERPGNPSGFACPDCGGVLWELEDGNLIRFRCRVGHAFSAESLLAQQSDALEDAMWVALRALEESAALTDRLAKRALRSGHTHTAKQYQERSQATEQKAELIRQALLNGISRVAEPEASEEA